MEARCKSHSSKTLERNKTATMRLGAYFILAVTILSSVPISSTVKSEQVWSVTLRPTVLDCATQPARNCHFITPTKRRIKPSTGCRLVLDAVGDDDIGRWACVIEDKEEKVFELSKALRPFYLYVEIVASKFEARCIASDAKPRPKFSWYLNGVRVINPNVTNFDVFDDHHQSIILTPNDTDKMLSCVIRHLTLEQPLAASIIVSFRKSVSDYVNPVMVAFVLGFFLFLAVRQAWKTCRGPTPPAQVVQMDEFPTSRVTSYAGA